MIPILVIVAALVALMWMYNILIARKNDVAKTFSYIDVLLKKRYDLIPNLVDTVKEYMGFERGLLTDVTELRSKAMTEGIGENERLKMESTLSRKLGNIMVAAENYPDLKANQGFIQLQSTWSELEEHIAESRRVYNASVTSYNNAVEMFPTNIIATLMDYKTKVMPDAAIEERLNVKAGELFKD